MKMTAEGTLRIPNPALEIDPDLVGIEDRDTLEGTLPNRVALPGARTSELRVIYSEYTERKLIVTFEGLAGSGGVVGVIRRGGITPKIEVDRPSDRTTDQPAAVLSYPDECGHGSDSCNRIPLLLHFPPGEGWKTITVTLTW